MAMSRHDMIRSEFLECLSERAENRFNGHLHQAFLDWYVDAEFGQHVQWKFTDGPSDGGLDAVVWLPNETPSVASIQSKFTEKVGASRLGSGAYHDFRRVAEAFHYGGDLFDDFLEGVRADAKTHYRRAFDILRDEGHWARAKKAFRLITTAKGVGSLEFEIPQDNFVYAEDILRIYERYRRGFTPSPKPLKLTINDKMVYTDRDRCMRSYLFNARVCEFREYFRTCDVARLVARNIRYNLGGAIGKGIRNTYEKHYRKLFPSRSRVARRFKKMYLAYRLFELLTDSGYPDRRTERRQRHGLWNCLWLLHLGVTETPGFPAKCSLDSIRNGMNLLESTKAAGIHARVVLRRLTRTVWQAWRKARKADPERWTPNNFFKSAFGNRQLLKLVMPKVRADLRWLGSHLLEE